MDRNTDVRHSSPVDENKRPVDSSLSLFLLVWVANVKEHFFPSKIEEEREWETAIVPVCFDTDSHRLSERRKKEKNNNY